MYNNVPQNGTAPFYGAHPPMVNPMGIPPPGTPFTMLPQVPPMVLPEVPMNIPGYETILQQAYYQGAMNLMNNMNSMLPLRPAMGKEISSIGGLALMSEAEWGRHGRIPRSNSD